MAGRAWRVAWAMALVAACLMALAACGGDDDGDAATRATPGSAAPIAAVQDDHLPVDPVETVPERVRLIAETGARVTRVDFFWANIAPERPAAPRDPDDAAYDWARTDLTVRELQKAGITPIVAVYNSPVWATDAPAPEPGIAVNTNAPDPDAFADFMAAVATRYAGDFTPRGADEPLPAVTRFELWNEPNLSGFLTPQVEDGKRVALDNYAAMVKAAYPAVKRSNPDATVIAGVAGPRSSSSDTGTGAMEWLRGLQERDIPLDAYSQHIYPAAAPTAATEVVPSWGTIDTLLDALDGFEPGLPMYITEAGYTTASTPYRDTKVTDDQQAQYLTEIFALPQLQTERIPAVVWFNLQDNVNWPAGLLREDLSQKPSYERFRDVTAAQEGRTLAP